MPQDVDYAVVRQNLEEGGIRSIPAFKNFLDNAHMIVEPAAEWSFVSLPPLITPDLCTDFELRGED